MLLAGGGQVPSTLAAIGVRIQVVGSASLRSAVPLGFVPSGADAAPVLVTTDVAGLASLPGLSGLYRTYSWLAPLTVTGLRGWQLAGVEDRLARSQARLLLTGSQFSLSAPFTALDQARAQASAAPQRLLLAGGGAIAALALFIVLAGGGLRRDQRAELDRLRQAGARTRHCVLFVAAESGWLCAAALSVGAAAGIGAAALLASTEGEPAGAILTHSLITPAGAIALAAGWLAATVLLAALVPVRSARLIDVLAVAAASALVAALVGGTGLGGTGSDQALALLLAPLCCLAVGVLTFRAAGARAAGSGAGGPGRPGAHPPRAGQPRPLSHGAGAGHRVRRRRGRPRRLRPRLPVDADPQRGRSGGGPRPARRPGLARAGFQHPARVGSAAALASARGRRRAAHPPDRCELHQWRGDRDSSRARRSRRRPDPDPRLAGERRLGAADRARPAPRANRPGPGAWTDASGRRALAVAASFAGPPGRRDRGPARFPGSDPAGRVRNSRRGRRVPARPGPARTVGAGGPRARRAHRYGHHQRPSERRESGRRNSVSDARRARAFARPAGPWAIAAERAARRLARGRRRGNCSRAERRRRDGRLRHERNTRRAPAGAADPTRIPCRCSPIRRRPPPPGPAGASP